MTATPLFLILLAVAHLLLLILLALYLAPATIEMVAIFSRERAWATATLTWGFAVVGVRVSDGVQVLEVFLAGHRVITRDLRDMIAANPRSGERGEGQKSARELRDYIEITEDLWPHLRRILETIYRSIHIETLQGDITLGLESPADTGVVYGYCTAVRYALWPAEEVEFVVTPVFDREVFEGTLTLRMRLYRPLLILIAVTGALLKKPVREQLCQKSVRGAPGV
jgi:hypothetical protein